MKNRKKQSRECPFNKQPNIFIAIALDFASRHRCDSNTGKVNQKQEREGSEIEKKRIEQGVLRPELRSSPASSSPSLSSPR
jgi:hypothetical protein